VPRCALSGFFLGIGRTRVVMLANLAGMLVNLPANFVLIYGQLGFPAILKRPAGFPGDAAESSRLAAVLIRLTSIYTLADSAQLVFAGALRGAGGTRWVMWAEVLADPAHRLIGLLGAEAGGQAGQDSVGLGENLLHRPTEARTGGVGRHQPAESSSWNPFHTQSARCLIMSVTIR
jgi:hypothetical protein